MRVGAIAYVVAMLIGCGKSSPAKVDAAAIDGSHAIDAAADAAADAALRPFRDPVRISISPAMGPWFVAIADFNGDGNNDLAVVESSALGVLLNTTSTGATTPSFTTPVSFPLASGDYFTEAVADFNGDGKPDVVVADVFNNDVVVLLNTTAAGAMTPTFATPTTFATAAGPVSVAVDDFNGDGKPDIAVTCTNKISILLNTTTSAASVPTFATHADFTAANSDSASLVIADFNGDGKPDLAFSSSGSALSTNVVEVMLDTTASMATMPSFAAAATFATAAGPDAVVAADFDGDGKRDLAVTATTSPVVSVLRNTTAALATTPSFANHVDYAVIANPLAVATSDLDGNGTPDLAIAEENSKAVSVLYNSGGTFGARADYSIGVAAHHVAVADFNGDGKPDLAVAAYQDEFVAILLAR